MAGTELYKKKSRFAFGTPALTSILCLATALLTVVYLTNFIDGFNTAFADFQQDSEFLVRHTINMAQNGWELNGPGLDYYRSSFGLQGYVAHWLQALLPFDITGLLHFLCAFLAAAVFVAICHEVAQYAGPLMGAVFYLVFLLSPWVVNMARNLYWVEYTWFLPMLVGVLYANDRLPKRGHYFVLAFATVLIKALCGYEFVTTVLVSMMAFPCLRLLSAFYDKKDFANTLKTVVGTGVAGLLGVLVAMVMHAMVLGEGHLWNGLQEVYLVSGYRAAWSSEAVILQHKASDNFVYEDILWTVNTPLSYTLKTYLTFSTQILFGISEGLFVPLIIVAFVLATAQSVWRRRVVDELVLLAVFFFSMLSWLVLAKPHANAHPHIVYVLWYMGFVQTALYCVANGIWTGAKTLIPRIRKSNEKNGDPSSTVR